MHEPERHKHLDKKHPVKDIVETLKYVTYGHVSLGIIILSGAILFSSTKIIMWSQQPYFLALQLPKQYYGLFMAVGWVLGGLSSHWAHLLDGKINVFRAMAVVWCGSVLACIGAGIHLGYPGIAFLMFGGSCIYGMASPRVYEAINHNVGSERRATALSTLSLLGSCLFIPVSSVIGWASDHLSIQAALFALAAWLLAAGTGLFWLISWGAERISLRNKKAGSTKQRQIDEDRSHPARVGENGGEPTRKNGLSIPRFEPVRVRRT